MLGLRCLALGLVVSGCGLFGDEFGPSGSGGSLGHVECDDADPTWLEREEDVLVLVNEVRATGASCGGQSFAPTHELQMQGTLRCVARDHSQDMRDRDFFDHTNPNGEAPADRVSAAGYEWRTVGENIAAGQPTPEAVMIDWINSPGHCRNIMSPDFVHIGVGYVPGGGAFPHYWTQNFAAPR